MNFIPVANRNSYSKLTNDWRGANVETFI